ncbi:hypothetical protein ABZ281_14165 [Streptomyces sp. NPDC006265]|uniref:hypothetical protein n=1 Tax=Streptomyces sp. NPDC006265 TaxID=3156740 RepID=UPI0033BA82BC
MKGREEDRTVNIVGLIPVRLYGEGRRDVIGPDAVRAFRRSAVGRAASSSA